MRKEIQNRLRNRKGLLSIAIACVLLASCSDVTDNDTHLPEGKFPLIFTAQVEKAVVTRATAENTWDGNEEIAIQLGNEVKKYVASAVGSLTAVSNETPFYWQSKEAITVNAWYPYALTKPAIAIEKDQSTEEKYQASDYLEATDAQISFSDPVINFYHRTAKIIVILTAGEGITLDDATTSVTFINQANVKEGTSVTPYIANGGSKTYTALLAPQQMQGKQFIQISTSVKDYFYTPKESADGLLEPSKQYTYRITVNRKDLSVTLSSNPTWTQEGADVSISSLLPGFSAKDLKMCDYYYNDGTWSDGGFRKYKNGTTVMTSVQPVMVNPDTKVARNVIGIVFYAGKHATDNLSDYSKPLFEGAPCIGSNNVRGYVLALTDVGTLWQRWAWNDRKPEENYSRFNVVVGASTDTNDWNGYSNQTKFREYVGKSSDWLMTDFPSANGCEQYGTLAGYEKYAAFQNSSGWFLPSLNQLQYLYDNREVLAAHIDGLNVILSDDNIKWFIENDQAIDYFSSTEDAGGDLRVFVMNFSYVNNKLARWKSYIGKARAICVF